MTDNVVDLEIFLVTVIKTLFKLYLQIYSNRIIIHPVIVFGTTAEERTTTLTKIVSHKKSDKTKINTQAYLSIMYDKILTLNGLSQRFFYCQKKIFCLKGPKKLIFPL